MRSARPPLRRVLLLCPFALSLRPLLSPRPCKAAAPKGPAVCFINYSGLRFFALAARRLDLYGNLNGPRRRSVGRFFTCARSKQRTTRTTAPKERATANVTRALRIDLRSSLRSPLIELIPESDLAGSAGASRRNGRARPCVAVVHGARCAR